MTSKEIAALTGNEHKNVLADCDRLNSNYLKMNMAKILVMEINHLTVKDRRDHVLIIY